MLQKHNVNEGSIINWNFYLKQAVCNNFLDLIRKIHQKTRLIICQIKRWGAYKVDSEKKEGMEKTLNDAPDNQSAENEDYNEKIKELEDVYNPIIKKAYNENSSNGSSFDSEDECHDELLKFFFNYLFLNLVSYS